ncbi:MAG: DUF962 domain-containing protein [Flavobacteriaceae bacterium]|nr:DUF962 domain-containing protein [Flavobacteriaceae bacterium]
MRTLNQWFAAYGESHQNHTNKRIHYICVPVIFFTIVGLLMSIPNQLINNVLPGLHPALANWALPILLFVLLFYIRLSISLAIKIAIFSFICLYGNYIISNYVSLWLFSLSVFVLAWIGQFYGHHIEGKKPSFLEDLQFLLIGPAWVMENLFKK